MGPWMWPSDVGSRWQVGASMLEQKVTKVTKWESRIEGGGGSGREKSGAVPRMTGRAHAWRGHRRLGGLRWRPENSWRKVAKNPQKSCHPVPRFQSDENAVSINWIVSLRSRFSLKTWRAKRSAVANESGASGRKPDMLPWSKLSGSRERGRLCRVERGSIEES